LLTQRDDDVLVTTRREYRGVPSAVKPWQHRLPRRACTSARQPWSRAAMRRARTVSPYVCPCVAAVRNLW